jgi:hypothetical protein
MIEKKHGTQAEGKAHLLNPHPSYLGVPKLVREGGEGLIRDRGSKFGEPSRRLG